MQLIDPNRVDFVGYCEQYASVSGFPYENSIGFDNLEELVRVKSPEHS